MRSFARLTLCGLLLGGCSSRGAAPGPVVPVDLPSATAVQVATWVAATLPSDARQYRFKWLFFDGRASAGGPGSVRIAPPDSLRFDASGLFGIQSTAAAVIGDHPLWVEPPDALERLVPNYPLLWAMLGIARPPESGVELRGVADSVMAAWRYIQQADTVEYVYTRTSASNHNSAKLVTEVRRAGEVVGHAETTLGPDGTPLKSKLTVPSVPATLDLTFRAAVRMPFDTAWLRHTP